MEVERIFGDWKLMYECWYYLFFFVCNVYNIVCRRFYCFRYSYIVFIKRVFCLLFIYVINGEYKLLLLLYDVVEIVLCLFYRVRMEVGVFSYLSL